MPTVMNIEDKIRKAIKNTVSQMRQYKNDINEACEKSPIYLLINGSFFYRNKKFVKTLQSPKRIIIKINKNGTKEDIDIIGITDDVVMNAHYKIEKSIDNIKYVDLNKAIENEIKVMGDVIFLLLREIIGLRSISQDVSNHFIHSISLDRSLDEECKISDDGIVCIKDIITVEKLLGFISEKKPDYIILTEKDRQEIVRGYDQLLDNAITDVKMPVGKVNSDNDTIFKKINDSLNSQTDEYKNALKVFQNDRRDNNALNEVLRIAYNFSTDALPLVFLFMSISDVKPLMFWCTVDKQWALYRSFSILPWSLLGKKEDLEEYTSIISEARNSAFHHILPFNTTIDVNLSDVEIKAESIQLFHQYNKKGRSGLRVNDQELIDVFSSFARAKQRPVSFEFWQNNLNVFKAVSELSNDILDTLIILWNSHQTS